MKIFSRSLELKILRRVCRGDDKGSFILGKLKKEYFHTSAGRHCFARIMSLVEKNGIPSWETLGEDPVIGGEERKQIAKTGKLSDKSLNGSLDNLKKYHAMRQMLSVTEKIYSRLHEDSVDVEKLQNEVADDLLKIRTGSKNAKIHWFGGKKNNTSDLIKNTLEETGVEGIPTGFKTWDRVNGVIPNEACMLVCSTTGSGKSIMAGQLCKNMAEMGYEPALTSLEMSARQLSARVISNLSSIPLEKFSLKDGITENEKKKALKDYRKWVRLCGRASGGHMIYEPESTPTMNQLLYSLKPYDPDVIIIDYIALLDDVDGDNDWRKMSEAVRSAKRFAKSNRIPVIILAQLGDDMQLRYSKRMLDDADIAWMWLGDSDAKENGVINIKHGKARNMNPIPFSLRIEWKYARIEDLKKQKTRGRKSGKGIKTGLQELD